MGTLDVSAIMLALVVALGALVLIVKMKRV